MAEVTSGVKYIKINRLDTDGEDYGPRITNTDNIRINYSDIGPVQYDILTIQQQSNYYLLGVINQPITSSINKILDYRVEATTFPAGTSISSTPTTLDTLGASGWNVINNSLQYFISQSPNPYYSYYILGNTPNTKLIFTASGSIQNSSGDVATLYFTMFDETSGETDIIKSSSVNIANGITATFRLSITASGNELNSSGSILGFQLNSSDNLTLSPNALQPFTFIVSSSQQSITPPSSLLVISPDILNFDNSDGNAIINNAVTPQYSTIYQDIDYSTGLVPTNFNLLANGNADYAPVQDSNYTSTGWANSRYKGSRASSLDFNVTS